jgi:hypothetical protein
VTLLIPCTENFGLRGHTCCQIMIGACVSRGRAC